jgi:hypothetical protein
MIIGLIPSISNVIFSSGLCGSQIFMNLAPRGGAASASIDFIEEIGAGLNSYN